MYDRYTRRSGRSLSCRLTFPCHDGRHTRCALLDRSGTWLPAFVAILHSPSYLSVASRDRRPTMLRHVARPPMRPPAPAPAMRAATAVPRRYLSMAAPKINLAAPARLVAPVLDLTLSAVSSALQRKWTPAPIYEHFESITAAARPQVTRSIVDVASRFPFHLLAGAAALLRTRLQRAYVLTR